MKQLKSTLKQHEEMAGESINFNKSEISAIGNIDEIQLMVLGENLGMKVVNGRVVSLRWSDML